MAQVPAQPKLTGETGIHDPTWTMVEGTQIAFGTAEAPEHVFNRRNEGVEIVERSTDASERREIGSTACERTLDAGTADV